MSLSFRLQTFRSFQPMFMPVRMFSTKQSLAAYFEEKMKANQHHPEKPIILGAGTFEKLVKRMESADDVKTVLNAYCNYVGHRNVLK